MKQASTDKNSIKRKIVFVIHSLGMGGAERVLANLSTYWVDRFGWDVLVLTMDDASNDHYAIHQNVRFKALNIAGDSSNTPQAILANIKRLATLRAEFRKESPDIVIGMMNSTSVLVILASLGLDHIRIATEHIHPPMFSLSPIWSLLRRWTYRLAHRTVSLTEQSGQWIRENCPGSKVAVIPNPIPYPLPTLLPRIPPDTVISPDRKVLLAMGRLCMQKGFDILIQAFSGIAAGYPDWDLVIGGEGPDRSILEDMKNSIPAIAHRVHLAGRIGNVGEWYERADLFVFSSRYEGFGLTLAEAMAYGCPVVSFDCDTGPRDIVQHGVNGLLVPLEHGARGLADALSQLMSNDARRAEMGLCVMEVRSRFSIERISMEWDRLFQAIDFSRTTRNLI